MIHVKFVRIFYFWDLFYFILATNVMQVFLTIQWNNSSYWLERDRDISECHLFLSIFQRLEFLIPSSQICLVFSGKVLVIFLFICIKFHYFFIHLAITLYIYYITIYTESASIVTDWTIAEDLRLVDGLSLWWYYPWHHLTQPFYKWALIPGDSELTFLYFARKKWPKAK